MGSSSGHTTIRSDASDDVEVEERIKSLIDMRKMRKGSGRDVRTCEVVQCRPEFETGPG
jgi:hypothetical protein